MTTSPSPSVPALELAGLVKSFRLGLGLRRRQVLGGIDLGLAPGRSLGLVGPNGSGKSTLLRIAAGVEQPDAGRIAVFGHAPGTRAARTRTGYLAETSPFPGELTGMEVLDLVGSLAGLPRRVRRERARSLLEQVGLGAEAHRPLARHSKGMQRRFGLAQTFLGEPDLVLLDEPTAGLDAPGYPVLEELLEGARARGAAVVFCSHVLSDVVEHCDELCVLIDGRIVAAGTPLSLAGDGRAVRVEVEGVAPADLDALASRIEETGARVVSRGPAQSVLLEIYRRLGRPGGGPAPAE